MRMILLAAVLLVATLTLPTAAAGPYDEPCQGTLDFECASTTQDGQEIKCDVYAYYNNVVYNKSCYHPLGILPLTQ